MHKPRAPNSTPPFRPIVSSIGTYNYSLAKYLSNLLQPHIPSTFIASDSFTFVKEINDLSLYGMFMVSFDVESLLTNTPLDDCINLAVEYITEGNPGLKVSKNELKRLFEKVVMFIRLSILLLLSRPFKAKMVNLLPIIRLAQSILKRKFPSVDKPLRI